ncbi:MAG: hypothetical protein ABI411_08000 [Tahibacter sp.]
MRITGNLALLGSAVLGAAQFVSGAARADVFTGTNTGPIPEAPAGAPSCGVNNLGEARVVEFNVSGLTIPVFKIKLGMNLTHTWRGDLIVALAAPGGTPSKIVFSLTGSNVPNGCGSNGTLNGLYTFTDTATQDWWQFASGLTPPGDYLASEPGGFNPGGAPTALSTEFRNLSPAQANGIWKLYIWDAGDQNTGTINAATLDVDQSDVIFADGFQTVTTP